MDGWTFYAYTAGKDGERIEVARVAGLSALEVLQLWQRYTVKEGIVSIAASWIEAS